MGDKQFTQFIMNTKFESKPLSRFHYDSINNRIYKKPTTKHLNDEATHAKSSVISVIKRHTKSPFLRYKSSANYCYFNPSDYFNFEQLLNQMQFKRESRLLIF